MKKGAVTSLLLAILAISTVAVAVDGGKNHWWARTYDPATTRVGDIPWTTSNLETLRGFNKQAIVRFFNESGAFGTFPRTGINPGYIWEFKWMDLAGDGKVELVTIESSGPCCVVLGIDRQDAVGRVSSIGFNGASAIKNTVRDLNGNGKYELILYTYLKSDGYQGTTPVAMWPRVYRLKGGKYVEASRDFPDFYDKEILPKLDEEICNPPPGQDASILEMERGKILRFFDRDPTAGLRLAREWMTSPNPEMVRRASVVFADMGLKDEQRAAVEAYKQALRREPRGGAEYPPTSPPGWCQGIPQSTPGVAATPARGPVVHKSGAIP